jgi:hypothetical protein
MKFGHRTREHLSQIPECDLLFNHRPVISDDSHGMWRRIHLIPLNRKFEGGQCDQNLPEKLKEEAAGILAWMVWRGSGKGWECLQPSRLQRPNT